MLKQLHIEDFTVFADATLHFGALNVIHGENSSGKTHVLKLAYSALASLAAAPNEAVSDRPTKTALESRLGSKLVAVFRPDKGKLGRLARRVQGTKTAQVTADFESIGALKFSFSTRSDRATQVSDAPTAWLTQAPIFLPTRELLSIYPGFVSLYQTQAIPFDETWRDTCLVLGAPVARGPKKKAIADLLTPLEQALGCKAVLEGDRFFVEMKNPNAKVEADLVAEGYRKLTMVARLIANGSLDDKGYLLWDEPEANLNPRLIRRLAPLLLDLAAGGVQVFVATHSLFLMRELAIEQTKRPAPVATRYFGLHVSPDGVVVSQGIAVEDSGDLASLDESLAQSDRYLALEQG
jgi:energy-coupling factor transporter ATP-binding protein EcfA2